MTLKYNLKYDMEVQLLHNSDQPLQYGLSAPEEIRLRTNHVGAAQGPKIEGQSGTGNSLELSQPVLSFRE